MTKWTGRHFISSMIDGGPNYKAIRPETWNGRPVVANGNPAALAAAVFNINAKYAGSITEAADPWPRALVLDASIGFDRLSLVRGLEHDLLTVNLYHEIDIGVMYAGVRIWNDKGQYKLVLALSDHETITTYDLGAVETGQFYRVTLHVYLDKTDAWVNGVYACDAPLGSPPGFAKLMSTAWHFGEAYDLKIEGVYLDIDTIATDQGGGE